MTTAINMVMVDCRKEIEEAYNKWYDQVHIPMCLKYKDMLRATRYRLLHGPEGQSRYLTIYEFQDKASMDAFSSSPECTAATSEMRQTWQPGDFTIKTAAQYEMIAVHEK